MLAPQKGFCPDSSKSENLRATVSTFVATVDVRVRIDENSHGLAEHAADF